MAKVTLEAKAVKADLTHLSKKLEDAINWLPDAGEIALDISEPYEFDDMGGPDTRHPCFGPPPHGERAEVGILLAVFEAMRTKEKKVSAPTKKAPRRK